MKHFPFASRIAIVVAMCLSMVIAGVAFADERDMSEDARSEKAAAPQITGSVHIQNVGDQEGTPTDAGDILLMGTSGRALRMEAVRLSLEGESLAAGESYLVRYRAHVQDVGWQGYVFDGQTAGTSGQALRVEALQIELNERLAKEYDVYYRVHVQNLGWMAWAKNGALSGSEGQGLRLEAIQIVLVKAGGTAPSNEGQDCSYSFYKGESEAPEVTGDVTYSAHCQDIGWQDAVADGATSGTTGRSLRMEAVTVNTSVEGLGVRYRAHVQDVGWQDWKSNGSIAGTEGQGKRVEALVIELTGAKASEYNVWYRVHVAEIGWLDWAENGAVAGTEGRSLPMEAYEVVILPSDKPAPGPTDLPAVVETPEITAKGYSASEGWSSSTGTSVTIGTTGKGLRLEGIKISADDRYSGSITYSAHVADVGWVDPVSDGAMAGGEDTGKQVEAVSISLTGNLGRFFDVYYRAHCEAFGWLGWAKNGEYAGTATISYRMEALDIVILPKGSAAPGSTEGAYQTKPYNQAESVMEGLIRDYSSDTEWLLAVDTTNCIVGIYTGSAGNWSNYVYWPCCPGAPSSPTVKGVYTVTGKGYSFGSGYTCYYYTQFYGDYLFHSILYDQGTFDVQDATMGVPASHGCVRMWIEQAKWIYDTIPYGTTVYIY